MPPKYIGVSLLSEEDIPTCFQVLSKSFGHGAPFFDMYFLGHDTPTGQAQGIKRLTSWMRNSPNSAFFKAVTLTDQGDHDQIIGIAIWTLMKEAPPAELEKAEDVYETWPDEDDREFMTELWRDYVVPRTRVINESNGKGVYVLELLAVHPDYQRLGAGTALVRIGTNSADDEGVKAVVEGSPAGQRLYEQCGLHTEIKEMSFNVSDKFSGRRMPKLAFMMRDPIQGRY